MRYAVLVGVCAFLGCHGGAAPAAEGGTTGLPAVVADPAPAVAGVAVADPLPASVDPLALAKACPLGARSPEDHPGLHNLFTLSANILSGSEPQGAAGLDALAGLGVRTILSVDGKAPDADGAATRGMRYVHIPTLYSGVAPLELLRIAKTFRELPGPFYVHCFHGKHRGPSAAEVGRLVLDGVSREQALAEMRQWCGTAEKYVGLYRTVASAAIPTPTETAACPYDFPARQTFAGIRQVMVPIPRAFDTLEALAERRFETDPEHPDAVAAEEATQLAGYFAQAAALPDTQGRPEDYRRWMAEAERASGELRDALRAGPDGGDAARERALAALASVKSRCAACHKAYRD